MQGSLESPPIVLKASKSFFRILFGIALVFFIVAIMMMIDATAKEDTAALWRAYACFVFFAALVVAGVWKLRGRESLVVDVSGITVLSLGKPKHYPWSDISSFQSVSLALAESVIGRMAHVGMTLSEQGRNQSLDQAFGRAVYGIDVQLGSGWELPPQKMCDLLNEARARWVGRS